MKDVTELDLKKLRSTWLKPLKDKGITLPEETITYIDANLTVFFAKEIKKITKAIQQEMSEFFKII